MLILNRQSRGMRWRQPGMVVTLFGYAFLTLLAALSVTSAAAQQTPPAGPTAKYTEGGTERCLTCHASERMTVMGETAHGNRENPHTPFAQRGCESCHGPGSLHVSRARGGAGFPKLLRFVRGEPVAQQNNACLDCHAKTMDDLPGMEWTGSLHDNGRITCAGCHKAHVKVDPITSATTQKQNCARCHAEQIATHPKFADKGIIFEQLTCFDCHDVHQLMPRP